MPVLIIGGEGKAGKKPMMGIGGKMSHDEPDGDEGKMEETSKPSDAAQKEAARALIRAVKVGDVEGVSEALRAHYDACEATESDEEY